ncbi:MAG: hypothetical protein GX173_05305 [Ruminococcaceae bacterium]|jgi:hypothetical protein|nr:hypothetical protein [Oscillospiraceae bacterium]
MNGNDTHSDRLTALNTVVNGIAKSWHILKQTDMTWNIKNARQHLEKVRPLIQELAAGWQAAEVDLVAQSDKISQELQSDDYIVSLERELQAVGVQFSGSFPAYMLPPFKLNISLGNYEARLSLGRKNERTSDLNPQRLAKWVGMRYKKVLARKFNATSFMKDLIEAYRIANQLKFHDKKMVWGRAVPIIDLYDLLTVKATTRQDYPKQFFVFDLGLFKETATLEMDRYRFELGFARNPTRAMTVVDSSGRESHISSLTIYLDEGDDA